MPADRIVDAALDQDELPVGDGILAARIIDLARRKPDRQPGEHQRQDGAFPESQHFLPGHDGEQVRAGLLRFGKDRGERLRPGEGIGIHKAQPIASGGLDSLEQGMRLAGPTGRELCAVEHLQPLIPGGIAAQDGGRGVRRAVVQHDQLEIRIGLGQQAFHTARGYCVLRCGPGRSRRCAGPPAAAGRARPPHPWAAGGAAR